LFFNIVNNDNKWTSPLSVEVAFFGMSVLSIPVQLSIAVFFLSKAFRFRELVYFYLQPGHSLATGQLPSFAAASMVRVGKLFFWLAVSAICIFVYAIVTIISVPIITLPSTTPINVHEMFAYVFFASMSRIGVSFAQVWMLLYNTLPP